MVQESQTTMDDQLYKDALTRKRTEILGTGGIKPLQASMENNTRQGDMADQASGNNEVHIQLRLKQTDAKILQAIDEELTRQAKKGEPKEGEAKPTGKPRSGRPVTHRAFDAAMTAISITTGVTKLVKGY